MLNTITKAIYTKIQEHLQCKNEEFVRGQAGYLGVEIKQNFHKERIMFTLSQHIAHYLVLHIQQSQQGFLDKRCNINGILKRQSLQSIPNIGRSHSRYFNLAVYYYHYFCCNYNIWNSVTDISEVQELFENQVQGDQAFQAFRQNQHIKFLSDQRNFYCVCRNDQAKQIFRCEKCLKTYHPACQYQKIVCNKCYLSFFFLPLDSRFLSIFGQKTNVLTYFHGVFRSFNNGSNKKAQFFVIKFDVDSIIDLQNAAQPQIMIKLMNFKDLSPKSTQQEKWKSLTAKTNQYSMILNQSKFQFFMNFCPLKRKNLLIRDQNSLIFKLQNRIVNQKDNIFMIKCDPCFYHNNQYEIGIYRVSKVKSLKLQIKTCNQSFQRLENDELTKQLQKSRRITLQQYRILQEHNSRQSVKQAVKLQTKNQKFNEDQKNINNKKGLNLQLVRSYGCNHKQGFNLSELRRYHKNFIQIHNQKPNQKQKKDQIEKLIEVEMFKVYRNRMIGLNIKTEEQINSEQNNFRSIRKYCIQNNLLNQIQIPEIQKLDKNLLNLIIKKYCNKYQRKSPINKKRLSIKKCNQMMVKQQKRFMKFVKCPICYNNLTVLYLLPYESIQGQQMGVKLKNRNKIKTNKSSINQQDMRQSILQSFLNNSAEVTHKFPQRWKKQQQSDCQEVFNQKQKQPSSQNASLVSQQYQRTFKKTIQQQTFYVYNTNISLNTGKKQSQKLFVPIKQEKICLQESSKQRQVKGKDAKKYFFVMSQESSYDSGDQQLLKKHQIVVQQILSGRKCLIQGQNAINQPELTPFPINYKQSQQKPNDKLSNQSPESSFLMKDIDINCKEQKLQCQQKSKENNTSQLNGENQHQNSLQTLNKQKANYFKGLLHFALLSEDQEQEGEMELYDQIIF